MAYDKLRKSSLSNLIISIRLPSSWSNWSYCWHIAKMMGWGMRHTTTNSVGRRGTNQLRLLERYLDVLVKHTTEIPPPTALVEETAPSALVEDVSLGWFILSCECCISISKSVRKHATSRIREMESPNSSTAFRFLQRLSSTAFWFSSMAFFNGFPIFLNIDKILIPWIFYLSAKQYLRLTQHTPVVHLCSQQCAISKI